MFQVRYHWDIAFYGLNEKLLMCDRNFVFQEGD